MSNKVQKMAEQIVPFLIAGIGIALLIGIFIMLSYVFVWGLIIGAVLWLIFWIKQYLSGKDKPAKSKGRIIEHDDK